MRFLHHLIFRKLIPNELEADSRTRSQAIRVIIFGLAMIFWAPVFAPIYLALGSSRSAVMIVLAAVAVAVSMLSLRLTKSIALAGNLIAGVIFAVLIGVACVSGGSESTSLWWLPAVPIIALVLCGATSGVAWAFVSCGATLAFFAAQSSGVAIPNDIDPNGRHVLECSAICGIILCASTLTLAFKLSEASARREVEAARDTSDRANKVKSSFLANMSHEIRTPMNAVLGMSRLLLDSDMTDEQRDHLRTIVDSGESLLTIINDILDLTRIESGKLLLEKTPFSLEELLFAALRPLTLHATEKGLELIGDIDPAVPPIIVGDGARLRQILINLVGNAIKFTSLGEVIVAVTVLRQAEQSVVLQFSVTDTGIGIPQERLPYIFDLFEQADTSTTRKYGGTGLGLAIVSRIAGLMGGSVEVESTTGQGSRFTVTLPFGISQERPRAIPGRTPRHLRGVKALIVDDNATCRCVIQRVLSHWGMEPALAASSKRAMEELQQIRKHGNDYDVILIDSEMPGVDSVGLAQELCSIDGRAHRLVVMLSGKQYLESVSQFESLGVAVCIRKPVSASELLDAICISLQGPTSARPDSTPVCTTTTGLPPLKILLAEDSLVNQKLAVALLQKQGHEVVVANNGLEAVAEAEAQRFDLILMDIQMPEMDGLAAAAAIRTREAGQTVRTPIIALTAHAMKGDRERCLEAGMDEYVAKPIRVEQLVDTIRLVVPKAQGGKGSQPCTDTTHGEEINWERVMRALDNDAHRLRTLVEEIIATLPDMLKVVDQAAEAGDGVGLEAAARTLKDSIRYFGTNEVFEQAFELERMGRDDRLAEARDLLPCFRSTVERLRKACVEYASETAPERVG